MEYQLHLNLRQREALRILISFWEDKEINDLANRIFESCDKNETFTLVSKTEYGYFEDLFRIIGIELAKSTTDHWTKDLLIQNTNVEFIHIAKMMAIMIFYWYKYIKYEYKAKEEGINGTDKIYWTPHGTIDVVKIFKLSWLGNPTLDITKVYNFACRYAIDYHINDLWNKIPKDMQVNCYKDIYNSFDKHILAYWKHLRDNDLSNLMRHLQVAANDFNAEDMDSFNLIYDLNRSAEENMLRLSVYKGYFIAMKYFWEKLTEEERNESLLKCAHIAILCFKKIEYKVDITVHKRIQYVEISIFLMNQMSKDHKKAFFNETVTNSLYFNYDVKDAILRMLWSVWPWQELFIPVLKDMIQYQDNNSTMALGFLNAITKEMVKDHGFDDSLKTNKYHVLLREAWLLIPAFIKQKMEPYLNNRHWINNLVNAWNLDNLELILNDPEIAHMRDQFINYGSDSYRKLVQKDEYEKLDQFINKILRSDEEIKQFKQRIQCWNHFIIQDQIHLADKLLDWQSSTPEERKSLKNNIDSETIITDLIEKDNYGLADKFLDWESSTPKERKFLKKNLLTWNICQNFIKQDNYGLADKFLDWQSSTPGERQYFKDKIDVINICSNLIESREYKLADKFLDWQFNTEEEKRNFKNSFKRAEDYVILRFYELWSKNNKDANKTKAECSKCLHWFFESEEEIRVFKKKRVFEFVMDDSRHNCFTELKRNGKMNDFLYWCILDEEQIQQIQQLKQSTAQSNVRTD